MTYQHKKALETMVADKWYWNYRGIDIKSFHIVPATLMLKVN